MKIGEVFYPPYKAIPKELTCVYKLSFDGGYNYIGSTVDLKLRLYTHLNCAKNKSNYLGLISDLPLVLLKVEVLYVDDDRYNCSLIEKSMIITEALNPLNLNKNGKSEAHEITIAKYLADGFTVLEIATHLEKNNRWIENVVVKMKRKFGAFTLPHLVAIFLREKIIK